MTDIIIKPSNSGGSVKLQTEGGTNGLTMASTGDLTTSGNVAVTGTVTAGDLTTSGNVAVTGTVTAGTLGSGVTLGANVAFNDAHKDIRKDDYILLGFSAAVTFASAAHITSSSTTLYTEVYKGSNITHPYNTSGTALNGRFKVGKAGVYLVWFSMHNDNTSSTTVNVHLVRNGVTLNDSGHSSDIAGNYGGRSYLQSATEIQYGTGGTKIIAVPLNADDYLNLYGSGDFYGSTSKPMGQFGAIRLGDRV